MATSAGRRSLFWRVNTATAYTMVAGAVAASVCDALTVAVAGGDDSAARFCLGAALSLALFLVIGFVVSLVTYGALLRHYALSPTPGDALAEPGDAAGTAAR